MSELTAALPDSAMSAGPFPPSFANLHPAQAPEGEPVWTCLRGRTRLCCALQEDGNARCQLTLLRNSRTYGRYEFQCREAALTFASRLRNTFEGNGWTAC